MTDRPLTETVTIEQAAAALGLSAEGVRSRLRRGTLAGERSGRTWSVFLTGQPHPARPVTVDRPIDRSRPQRPRGESAAELRAKLEAVTAERDWLRGVVEREQAAHGETRRLMGNLQAQMLALPAATVPATATQEAAGTPNAAEVVETRPRRWWLLWRR